MINKRLATSICLCCLILVSAIACGKRGNPEPRDQSRAFSWHSTNAVIQNKCLVINGTLQGAYRNLDSLRLELAPLQDTEDCQGCPFVAQEIVTFSPTNASFNRNTGSLDLTYCPIPAPAYRWRIMAISIYTSLPHAASPVQITAAP